MLWQPAYGHYFHLSPRDMNDLTFEQVEQMNREIKEAQRKQNG